MRTGSASEKMAGAGQCRQLPT